MDFCVSSSPDGLDVTNPDLNCKTKGFKSTLMHRLRRAADLRCRGDRFKICEDGVAENVNLCNSRSRLLDSNCQLLECNGT